MAAALAVRELEGLLNYAAGSLAVTTYDQVRQHLLPELVGLVGSDTATLTHLDLASQREVAIFWPTSRPDPKVMERYARVGHTHPLRPHLQTLRRAGRGSAHTQAAVAWLSGVPGGATAAATASARRPGMRRVRWTSARSAVLT